MVIKTNNNYHKNKYLQRPSKEYNHVEPMEGKYREK